MSVYVRNLPSTISTLDIMQEFKSFGRIKQDGVFLRNRKEVGVCYAFVEFEDIQSVKNAIKASPIQMGGRQVHIEERRGGSSSTLRGGGRITGRGRGGGRSGVRRNS
nr:putative G3BP-like protein [Ipomoea batatas]GMD26964.1 putative G3BP-like protein [Ipomoea batatas]